MTNNGFEYGLPHVKDCFKLLVTTQISTYTYILAASLWDGSTRYDRNLRFLVCCMPTGLSLRIWSV